VQDVEVVDLDFHAGCISARLAIGSMGPSDIGAQSVFAAFELN
jgi:hypothetical protein